MAKVRPLETDCPACDSPLRATLASRLDWTDWTECRHVWCPECGWERRSDGHMEIPASALVAALRYELHGRWSAFNAARGRAIVRRLDPTNERNGYSIEMLNIADRIGQLSTLVGSTSWEEVPVDVLLEGWWDAIHRRAGLEPPAFDRARAEELRAKRYEVIR